MRERNLLLFLRLDLEWFEDPCYLDLRDAHPGHPDRFMRCLVWAKRANEKGRIMRADGIPLDVRAMARIAEGRADQESIRLWTDFLKLAQELGIIRICHESGSFQIANWSRWHRSPSDEPERVRDRVNKHRAKKTSEQTGCNVTDVTTQSRAEQSRAEQSRAEHGPLGGPLQSKTSSFGGGVEEETAEAVGSPDAGAPSPRWDDAGGPPPAPRTQGADPGPKLPASLQDLAQDSIFQTPPCGVAPSEPGGHQMTPLNSPSAIGATDPDFAPFGYSARELGSLAGRDLVAKERQALARWQAEAAASHPWPVLEDAIRAAREQTLHRAQQATIKQPAAYAIALLPEALAASAAHHASNEARAKIGLQTTRYEWTPEADA